MVDTISKSLIGSNGRLLNDRHADRGAVGHQRQRVAVGAAPTAPRARPRCRRGPACSRSRRAGRTSGRACRPRCATVTSATPPAPNGSTSLTGFSGQAACADDRRQRQQNAAGSASSAQRRGHVRSPFVHLRILHMVRLSRFLLRRNRKAAPDCRPADAFAASASGANCGTRSTRSASSASWVAFGCGKSVPHSTRVGAGFDQRARRSAPPSRRAAVEMRSEPHTLIQQLSSRDQLEQGAQRRLHRRRPPPARGPCGR